MERQDREESSLTWGVLLAKWTEFARSAVALPETGEAGRYRRAVAPLITLHAVAHALSEIGQLDPEERALGLDRAELLIRRETEGLLEIWEGSGLPDSVAVFVEEALAALEEASPETDPAGAWREWIVEADVAVFEHPGELLEALAATGIEIDLHVPTPGVPFFAGAVAATMHLAADDRTAAPVLELIGAFLGGAGVSGPLPAQAARQVYRQFDFARGGPVRDVIAWASERTPGQPLLVPGMLGGEVKAVPLAPRPPEIGEPLPVVDSTSA